MLAQVMGLLELGLLAELRSLSSRPPVNCTRQPIHDHGNCTHTTSFETRLRITRRAHSWILISWFPHPVLWYSQIPGRQSWYPHPVPHVSRAFCLSNHTGSVSLSLCAKVIFNAILVHKTADTSIFGGDCEIVVCDRCATRNP